jgi:arylsulfatase A-like enzyme
MSDISRRNFVKAAGSAAFLGQFGTMAAAQANRWNKKDKKPNIVVIIVDDLGYGDLSCYGAKDLQTPNIDRLAGEGMRFDNFYANSPVCSPTRAALLTGRYPDMVGIPGVIRTYREMNWGYLDKNAVLLPQVLKKQGYKTALVGKWHLGLESPNTPNERGFEHFHGFLDGMMDDYYDHLRFGFNYLRLNNKEINPEGHATDLFTDWAVDYIDKTAGGKDPFFLYLAYTAPHTPIQPPQDWVDRVRKRAPSMPEKRAKLAALIEHMDDGIGKVINKIEDSGISDDTLIIFVSDNGGQLNVGANNGRTAGGKEDMNEGGIKVPMCAVWPGKIKPQSVNTNIGITMDLFPTICEAAGAGFEHEIDGKSFLADLSGNKTETDKDRLLFWVRREGNQYGGQAYYAVRRGEWKLLQNTPFEPFKLYNLKDDPMEENPLDSSHPMYGKLFEALKLHVNQTGVVPWQRPLKPEKQA